MRLAPIEGYVSLLKIKIHQGYSSIPVGAEFELPDFTVLTGKNGSGKTHLLQALDKKINVISNENNDDVRVRNYYPMGHFESLSAGTAKKGQIDKSDEQIVRKVLQAVGSFYETNLVNPDFTEEKFLSRMKTGLEPQVRAIIENFVESGTNLTDINEETLRWVDLSRFKKEIPSLFRNNISETFYRYSYKKHMQDYRLFLQNEERTTQPPLEESEFERRFSPKPWDVLNEILESLGLSYSFQDPKVDFYTTEYKANLSNNWGESVSLESLSSGEKVLLSIGLALFGAPNIGDSPGLILLDEPDAPLHPEYSDILVRILRETIVGKHGAKVILTSHSPTTIASCTDDEVYEMDPETRTPKKISRNQGIRMLTRGIPNLLVSAEARRIVFVESSYDEVFHSVLFEELMKNKHLSFEPVFFPPRSKESEPGSNADEVSRMVDALAEAGNDMVRGIVDWDKKRKNTSVVFSFGNSNRYAVENYILDPLLFGLAMVRNSRWKFEDVGLPQYNKYPEVSKLTNEDVEKISTAVLRKLYIDLEDMQPSKLENGWTVQRPLKFLQMRGHDWAKRILEKIPEAQALKSTSIGRSSGVPDETKLMYAVLEVAKELRGYLSADIRETYEKLE